MKKIITFTITILLTTCLYLIVQGQSLPDVDAGKALDDLRQNNAVVGIMWVIIVIQSIVIIVLWKKVDKINEEHKKDLKRRAINHNNYLEE